MFLVVIFCVDFVENNGGIRRSFLGGYGGGNIRLVVIQELFGLGFRKLVLKENGCMLKNMSYWRL